jgi:histidinol phosphatase-like enzyme
VFSAVIGQRDRDLELAARIGQSLLQRNNLLQERNEAVEEQLNQAIDQVASSTHLMHTPDARAGPQMRGI